MTFHPRDRLRFPLDDIELKRVENVQTVDRPVISSSWMSIAPQEFYMIVEEVGSFYARDGNYIEYSIESGALPSAVELFLNGSVYGALLHQRSILPIHGSSFMFEGICVMLCGESGAGKSSLTACVCLNGGEFLTDDVTPILFEDDKPRIWPRSGRIKLWEDSLKQLGMKKDGLVKIRSIDEKYYYELESSRTAPLPLHHVLILDVADDVSFRRVERTEAFTYLHNEIYRREFLGAMPETESAYLDKISAICNQVSITHVGRPGTIPLTEMKDVLLDYLSGS